MLSSTALLMKRRFVQSLIDKPYSFKNKIVACKGINTPLKKGVLNASEESSEIVFGRFHKTNGLNDALSIIEKKEKKFIDYKT